MMTAATALWFTIYHFIDIFVHRLFQVGDGDFKLTGGQPLFTGRAGGVGPFKPAQGLVDRCTAVRAVYGNHLFCKHVFDLLDVDGGKAFPSKIGFPVIITEMVGFWIGEETGRDRQGRCAPLNPASYRKITSFRCHSGIVLVLFAGMLLHNPRMPSPALSTTGGPLYVRSGGFFSSIR